MNSSVSIVLLIVISALAFVSCNNNRTENIQKDLDTLNSEIKNSYKPGLGEFMLTTQKHHAKLWFAGINENWPLANFEAGEIKETFHNAVKYLPERIETKDIPMIYAALDSLQASINTKDIKKFTDDFRILTKTCNDCHKAVHFQFIVIKIPTSEPVSNQKFKPRN